MASDVRFRTNDPTDTTAGITATPASPPGMDFQGQADALGNAGLIGQDKPPGDENTAGAESDPFAYTSGSLLTPWSGHFDSSKYNFGGGGYTTQVAQYTPYQYDKFSYNPVDVGQFGETYKDPAAFRFADFAGPSDFQAPTAEDMKADPGYQARMDAVKNAQVAGAAHGGVLRSGGFQKGLAQAVGNQASQEYGNVYQRRAAEHDRLRQEAQGNYQINQGNTFQGAQFNTANQLNAYKTREQAFMDNAGLGLRQGELNYNIATGGWDRNQNLARTQWQDESQHQHEITAAANATAASMAAAGASGNRARYEADLADYTRGRDEFWTNQDRQNTILNQEANRGLLATGQYGGQYIQGVDAQANYQMGGSNAQAAGTMAQGNAYASGLNNIGSTVGGAAIYRGLGQMPTPAPR